MKVLHLHSGNLFGGVETFFVTLARKQKLVAGTVHEFVLFFPGRLEQELRDAGATVIRLEPVRLRQPWSVLRARRGVAKLLRTGGYDAVVCHASWNQALFGSVARCSGLAHVFYLHGPIVKRQWPDYLAARIVPDLMIAVSRDTLNNGRALYPHVPAEVINYPIPWNAQTVASEDGRGMRQAMGADATTVVISQLSRLDRWKGQDLLLDALSNLQDLPGWTCWIAGGAQREHERLFLEELRRKATALDLGDRVHFIGERRDGSQIMAATDIYCQANRGPEGFSLAFMEAFASGCPIVTTNIGGAGEMIDVRCGILTAAGDAAAIAEGLRRLIVEPDLRRQMGVAARERVQALCEPVQQITRLADVLAAAVDRKRNYTARD